MLMQISQYWVKGESKKLSICGTTMRKWRGTWLQSARALWQLRTPFLSQQNQNEIQHLGCKTRKMQIVNKRVIQRAITSHEKKKCPAVLYPLSHLKTTSRVGVWKRHSNSTSIYMVGCGNHEVKCDVTMKGPGYISIMLPLALNLFILKSSSTGFDWSQFPSNLSYAVIIVV